VESSGTKRRPPSISKAPAPGSYPGAGVHRLFTGPPDTAWHRIARSRDRRPFQMEALTCPLGDIQSPACRDWRSRRRRPTTWRQADLSSGEGFIPASGARGTRDLTSTPSRWLAASTSSPRRSPDGPAASDANAQVARRAKVATTRSGVASRDDSLRSLNSSSLASSGYVVA
jgi:hypothetical protein